MKNQNDLIVAGAVVLVAIGVSLGFMFNKRTPAQAPEVPVVVVSEPMPVAAKVAMSDSLPGAGGGRGGSARARRGSDTAIGSSAVGGGGASAVTSAR